MLIERERNETKRGGGRDGKDIVPATRLAIDKALSLKGGSINIGKVADLKAVAIPKMRCVGEVAEKGFKRELGFFLNYGSVFTDFSERKFSEILSLIETGKDDKKTLAAIKALIVG